MDCQFCHKSTPPGFPRCLHCGRYFPGQEPGIPQSEPQVCGKTPRTAPARPQRRLTPFQVRLKVFFDRTISVLVGPAIFLLIAVMIFGIPSCIRNNAPHVDFSQTEESGTRVYADIVAVRPQYGVYVEQIKSYESVICRCKTADGDTIYMEITNAKYREHFDADFSIGPGPVGEFSTVTFDTPLRVYGVSQSTTGANSDKYGKLREPYILDFRSLEP